MQPMAYLPLKILLVKKTNFARWLRVGTELPDAGARMNCWQAVLTSAYYGGLVTREQLVAMHLPEAGQQGGDRTLMNNLGREDTDPEILWRHPQPGDIVMIDTAASVGHHVFIAGINRMAYSHDRTDAARSLVYRTDTGYGPMGMATGGSRQSMVYRISCAIPSECLTIRMRCRIYLKAQLQYVTFLLKSSERCQNSFKLTVYLCCMPTKRQERSGYSSSDHFVTDLKICHSV